MSTERSLAPSTCDLHVGGTFTIGMAGGYFYRCGCVWDRKEDRDPEAVWHRGVCQDERPLILDAQRAGADHA